jgi:hypothetical protein
VCSKSQGHSSAIWLPLLEKGICKHYSTYSLDNTPITMEEILIMCTGSPVISFGNETHSLRDNPSYLTNSAQNKLWNELVGHLERHSLIICQSVPPQLLQQALVTPGDISMVNSSPLTENGLLLNTSYTLLRLHETSTNEHILQFRTPFLATLSSSSDFEWTGDWSDSSAKWTSQLEFEIGIDSKQQTETFWISFSDFLKYFSLGKICLLQSEEGHGQGKRQEEGEGLVWSEKRSRSWFQLSDDGAVMPSLSSSSPRGGASYPLLSNMYVLQVSEPVEVHFTLHQQLLPPPYYQFDLGLAVLRVSPDYSFELIATTGLHVRQHVSTSAHLSPDVYLIVPLTTGARLINYRNKSRFRSGTSSGDEPGPMALFDHRNKRFIPQVEEIFSEIFDRLDNDMDDVSDPLSVSFSSLSISGSLSARC